MTDVKELYPARFYASYDTKAAQPTQVTGWYDTWSMGTTDGIPVAGDMIPISQEDWDNRSVFRMPVGRGVENGKIVDYTPPLVNVPIKDQATNELIWINQQASLAMAMGETFTSDMRAYVSTVRALSNGTQTATELPSRPTDIMS